MGKIGTNGFLKSTLALAECIYEEYPDKAVAVLEYCVSLGTDISGTYYLLGQYYLNHKITVRNQGFADY